MAAPSGAAGAREGGKYNEIHEFCKDLSLCNRGHALCHNNERYHVYCFSDPADAEKFKGRFGGERFNPNERGKGSVALEEAGAPTLGGGKRGQRTNVADSP